MKKRTIASVYVRKIFLWILEHGPSSLYEIHTNLKISEGTIYKILQELEFRKYISEYKKEKGKTRIVSKYGPTIYGMAQYSRRANLSKANLGKWLDYWKNDISFKKELTLHGFVLDQLDDTQTYHDFKILFKEYIDYASKVLDNVNKFIDNPAADPIFLLRIGETLLLKNDPKYVEKLAKLYSAMPGIRNNYSIYVTELQQQIKSFEEEIKKQD